ncbi:uncharacterized protein LOC144159137 [Haemaphysalis longicornis]
MDSSSEVKVEQLETKLAQVLHFDETGASFARSVLADCSAAGEKIDVACQSGRSQYSLLSTLQDKTAEATSSVTDIRKKRKTPCSRRTDNEDSALAYLAAVLGMEEEELFISSGRVNRPRAAGTASSAQESRPGTSGACGSTLNKPCVRGKDKKKVEPLEVALMRVRSAKDVFEAWDEEIKDYIQAHKSSAQAQQVGGTAESLLEYWLRLYIRLAQSDDNPNDSVQSAGSSFLDDSQLGLHAHVDLLGKQQAIQERSIQQRQQHIAKLTKDAEAMKAALVDLKVQNLELIDQIKANHMEGKDKICRTLRSEKSKIQRVGRLVQSTSAMARASVVSAELASSAEEGGASPKHANGESEYRDAILQATFESLRDAVAEGRTAEDLERQTRRAQSARKSLDKAARSIREENVVGASEETLREYQRLMQQDKAILLLDGTVDGRTFADWLPDVMALTNAT